MVYTVLLFVAILLTTNEFARWFTGLQTHWLVWSIHKST
jgi:hypothetical protein